MKEEIKKAAKEFREKNPEVKKMQDVKNLQQKRGEVYDDSKKEEVVEMLKEQYENIKKILRFYIDLKEEYYTILALWIIGTYLHNEFESFPYLFFNAMRGSGKSRTLRLVCKLAKEGNVMASPTEAVLFRLTGTIGIDEFEGVANKDKNSIREMLNGAYKKGIKIFRMKKRKSLEGEELVAEEFEPYRPVIMANITGMEEVLEDRCITLILEKSAHPVRTRLVEDFEENSQVKVVLENIVKCSLCSVVMSKNINTLWNNYISNKYKTTHTTHITHTTHTTQTTLHKALFDKIHATNIIGRNLELFLPLFFISNLISEKVLDETLKIAKGLTSEKKKEQGMESIDVMLLDFISNQPEGLVFQSVKDLTRQFREFADEGTEWLNPKWFGKALKRLNLVIDKKRKGYGIEVILNTAKAKEKVRMFKKEDEDAAS